MNPEQIQRILKIIARAPSPHNTQPVKWRFLGIRIQMLIESERILWVSDKELRDLHLSAGSAFYLLKLALKQEGLEPVEVKFYRSTFRVPQEVYLECSTRPIPPTTSPELMLLETHACYRGNFAPSTLELNLSNSHTHKITDSVSKKYIATLYDQASAFFLGQRDYAQELWKWLRLDKNDPRFYQDGLNAQMLRLNGFMTLISCYVLKPAVLEFLGKIKLLPLIVTEASQNNSAEGFIALTKDHTKSCFEEGEDLMKLWFEVESQGRVLCPVTALIDDPSMEKKLRKLMKLQNEIIHIVRYGVKPAKEELPLSPRLQKITL